MTILLERAAELEAGLKTLQSARSGSGSLLIVHGTPGLGRSVLLRSIADRAEPEAILLRADCSLLERDFDFGVVCQLLQPMVLAASADRVARWFAGAAESVRPLIVHGTAASPLPWDVVLPALTALVANLCAEQPVVLVIDDLQWADSSSLRWLGYLTRRLEHLSLAVLCGVSDGVAVPDPAPVREIVARPGRVLHLAPLSEAAVRRLIEEAIQADVEPDFAAAIHRVTAANPAALEIVLRGLRDRAPSPTAGHADKVEEQSHLLLLDRRMYCLALQPTAVQAVARSIAVLDPGAESADDGPLADAALVAALAAVHPCQYGAAIRALDRLGLMVGPHRAGFVHPTLAETILSAIPVEEQQRLHRRAAELLHEAGFGVAEIAEKLLAITSGYTEWETERLRAAADTALEQGTGRSAARYLRPVLFDTPPDSALRGRLLVDLAVAERSFDLPATVRHITQALPDLVLASERAAAVLWIPPGAAADAPTVIQTLRQADAELSPDRTGGPNRDLALRLEARVRYLDDQRPTALSDAVKRLGAADLDTLLSTDSGRELLAVLLHSAGLRAATPAGTLAGLAGRLLEHETPGPAHAYTTLPTLIPLLAAADLPAVADEWLVESLRQARQEESAGVLALTAAERSALLAAQGRLGEAMVLANTALEQGEWQDTGWPDATVLAMWTLTTVALATNDPLVCERVLRISAATDDLRVVAVTRLARGVRDLTRSDLPAALDRFLDCGRQLGRVGWENTAYFPWRLAAARVHAMLGQQAEARDLAAQEYEAALAWGAPAMLGRALCLRATLTEGKQALALRRQAVEVLADSADRLAHSRAMMVLARRLDDIGAPEAAPLRAEANSVAADCGASWSVANPPDRFAAVHREADRFGVPDLDGLILRLTAPDRVELTRSEETVAHLVRQNWTNQRIADALGITRRAVEKTLTGAYRKLGVQGRAGLVAALDAQDALDARDARDPQDLRDTRRN